jgi:hypothetical protein
MNSPIDVMNRASLHFNATVPPKRRTELWKLVLTCLEDMTALHSRVSSERCHMLLLLLRALYNLGKNIGVFFFHSW